MDRINAVLSNPENATMSLAQIVSEEIREFKQSEQYQNIVQAESYYRNRSDVQKKTNDVANRSNTRIEHPILKKLVDQKANYLLSKPWTVDTANGKYGDALNKVFDATFRRKIKSLGKGAVKSGIAWLQPYFDEGTLAFMRIPSNELIPLWKDAERTKLDAFIRFYDQIIYIGTRKHVITHAEFWWSGGVKWFKTDAFAGTGAGQFHVDKEHGDETNDYTEPHFVVGDKAYNWEEAPIAWLKYNEEELPLCYFIKDLIDDINWQTSVTADVLRDVAKFIYILRNYGGQDLAEFLKDLKEHMAIKVTTDGGVDKLQADLNIDAVMAFLDKQRRDVYDFAAAVDTKDPELGNASGTAINFRYMDLDADCDSLRTELKDTFQRLKLFIDVYLQMEFHGDYQALYRAVETKLASGSSCHDFDHTLRVINNARNSDGLLSKRTILQNHPWVADADEELDRINEEKKAAMEEFGEGLFDNSLGANAGQEGGDNGAGLNGGGVNEE